MERDTGSAESIIPHELYRKKFNDKPLYKTELMLLTYTGKTLFQSECLRQMSSTKISHLNCWICMWLRIRVLC